MKSVTRMARLPAPDPARKLGITGRMIGFKIIKYSISAEFHAEFRKIKDSADDADKTVVSDILVECDACKIIVSLGRDRSNSPFKDVRPPGGVDHKLNGDRSGFLQKNVGIKPHPPLRDGIYPYSQFLRRPVNQPYEHCLGAD